MRLNVDRELLRSFWDFSREKLGIKNTDDGEVWRDSDSFDKKDAGQNKFNGVYHAKTNQVELPFPLWYVEFDITARQNGMMQYGFSIFERDEGAFQDLSLGFSRRVASIKLNFFKTTPDLTGYVLNADDEVIADISDNNEDNARKISFGGSGSMIRRYTDYAVLAGEVGELESLANRAIIHCFRKNMSVERRLFDTNIYLALEPSD